MSEHSEINDGEMTCHGRLWKSEGKMIFETDGSLQILQYFREENASECFLWRLLEENMGRREG
jgi:hypothetical protein